MGGVSRRGTGRLERVAGRLSLVVVVLAAPTFVALGS